MRANKIAAHMILMENKSPLAEPPALRTITDTPYAKSDSGARASDQPEQLLTRVEVAQWLNLQPKTLANWASDGLVRLS